MGEIKIRGRWREELEAVSDEGTLIFEFTMGKEHVYFPDPAAWAKGVPAWAASKREEFLAACSNWCLERRIPISIVNDALVYEEK